MTTTTVFHGLQADHVADEDNISTEWMGYTFGRGERGMYWVTRNGVNTVPGAMCFTTQDSAMKGIAALVATEAILNGREGSGGATRAEIFTALLHVSK
jgi:hypothetical protein